MSKSISTLVRTLTLTVATLLGSSSIALASEPAPASTSAQQESGKTLEGKININTASAAELELLPGVGPATAARIIDYREARPFKERNQIMRIKGIGQKTFAKIKDYLIVEGETTLKLIKYTTLELTFVARDIHGCRGRRSIWRVLQMRSQMVIASPKFTTAWE